MARSAHPSSRPCGMGAGAEGGSAHVGDACSLPARSAAATAGGARTTMPGIVRDSLPVRQQLEQPGEERGDEAGMWIDAVCVVDGVVLHCEHAPPCAHGYSRLEVRRPDVLSVVTQPLRSFAQELPHVELVPDDAGHL